MKLLATGAVLCMASTLAGAAPIEPRAQYPQREIGGPATLDELLNPSSRATTHINPLRAQMLTEGAYTVGFRGGMASRSITLTSALRTRAESLDRM